MDPNSGRIYTGDEIEKIKDPKVKGRLVPIPDGDLTRVQGMNRKQRRAWAAEQRRK